MPNIPALGSVSTAVLAGSNVPGGYAISAILTPTASFAPPDYSEYSLQLSQVAQYTKNVYSVLVNGVAAEVGGTPGSNVGSQIAQQNLAGPFGAPIPPAGTAAGIPYAPGANHNDYAAAVMASLRSLAGNGTLFGQ
ncbi:MAG: hypothetical protein JO140_00265 [Candidatus Eremiobacteraeota bacterium]|nr:hypothetical protein [Candidatus Eremiobacteraeota bacterium]